MNDISTNFDLLSKFMSVSSLRHNLIAENVANVNTPGYRQLDVSFEKEFTQKLGQGDVATALQVKPSVIEGVGGASRLDGNNVDIDLEMTNLVKNTLIYRTLGQIMASQLATMRTAIAGR